MNKEMKTTLFKSDFNCVAVVIYMAVIFFFVLFCFVVIVLFVKNKTTP